MVCLVQGYREVEAMESEFDETALVDTEAPTSKQEPEPEPGPGPGPGPGPESGIEIEAGVEEPGF